MQGIRPGISAGMMSAAWEQNPQSASYEVAADGTRVVHWGYWGLIGLSWFLLVFVPLSLVGAGVTAFAYHLDKRKVSNREDPGALFRSP